MLLKEIETLATKEYQPKPLKILQYPDSNLKTISQVVLPIVGDTNLAELIADMKATLVMHKALGLSAIQVGVPVRVMVIYHPDGIKTLINPVTRSVTGKVFQKESCLSIPLIVKVPRAQKVLVDYLDEAGVLHNEHFDSWTALAYQHELDHLNGMVMLDRLSELRRKEALAELRKR